MDTKLNSIAWEFARQLDEYITFKHVSIVLRKNKIVAIGTNVRKTHPKAKQIGYMFSTRHSELDAFIRVPYTKRNNLTLINYRFNKRGELRLSKPCDKCYPWVISVFDEVFYSTNINHFERLL